MTTQRRPERRPERPPVAVGMPVARHPPHRPVLALLTHTVPTSDAWPQTARRATVAGSRLAAARRRAAPEIVPTPKLAQPSAKHVFAERSQPLLVSRHRVILEIPPHHLREPLRCVRNLRVHPRPQLLPDIFQLGCHAFADRLAIHREIPRLAAPPTNVREAQKIEGFDSWRRRMDHLVRR